jgi:hypothetical protein
MHAPRTVYTSNTQKIMQLTHTRPHAHALPRSLNARLSPLPHWRPPPPRSLRTGRRAHTAHITQRTHNAHTTLTRTHSTQRTHSAHYIHASQIDHKEGDLVAPSMGPLWALSMAPLYGPPLYGSPLIHTRRLVLAHAYTYTLHIHTHCKHTRRNVLNTAAA